MTGKDFVAWVELEAKITRQMIDPGAAYLWRPRDINAQALRIRSAALLAPLILERAPEVEKLPILEAIRELRLVFDQFHAKAKDQVEAVWAP